MIPVMGATIKIHEYQTPDENWGSPITKSQTTFNDAKMMIRGRFLFHSVICDKPLTSESRIFLHLLLLGNYNKSLASDSVKPRSTMKLI